MLRAILTAMLLAASTGAAASAQSYHPPFHPSALKRSGPGAPNAVMVLGTPHLSNLPESFDPAALAPLLGRLAAWKPQVITIEARSGAQCDFMRHYPDRYRDTIQGYCWDPAPARAATGLDVPAATAEVDRLLAALPADPTSMHRRHLAAVFLAAGDQASALVQWLRLPEAERHAGDGLDAALVARLTDLRDRHDETMLIAAPLAARLGLERVYPVDDHTADAPTPDEKAYADVITKVWDNPATAKRKAIDAKLHRHLATGDGLLALYRAENAPEMAKLVYDSDFGAALNEPSPQAFGRGYVGYWETRNLRIAANIRDILGLHPGSRALVLIGASHKFYLEAYLDEMHDVSLVDTAAVLK